MSTSLGQTSDPATQAMLRRRWADSTHSFVEFPRDATERSIPERFEEIVELYPENTAITSAEETLTYAELNVRANMLARALLARLGTESEPVALLLERSAALPAAILGTLKAGKLYVALDPTHPPERLKAMLADLQARMMVTNWRNLCLAQELANAQPAIDSLNLDSLEAMASSANVGLAISPDTFAAIFYSSGTTGQPKGAVHSHRTMLQFALRVTNTNRLCPEDRQPLFFSAGFSASMSPIFGTLLNGATLIVSDPRGAGGEALADWIIQSDATVLFLIPTAMRQIVESLTSADEGRFPKLRLLIMSGEPISQQVVSLWKQHFATNSVLLCLLGSSEAGIITEVLIDKDMSLPDGQIPAGYPEPDKEIALVQADGAPAEPGSVGEIVIKSRYLIPCYWRKPELTKATFRPSPDASKQRVYYSGDLGRFRADGALEWIGRKDFQIKVRGYAVQIAEVEMALLNTTLAEEVVVVAQPVKDDQQRLIAYLIARGHPTVREVRDALKRLLPDYMIPAAIIFLDALPRTPNGKVDRKALPVPAPERPQLGEAFLEPRNPVEAQVAHLWESVLNVSPIGVNDDFFELGGNSLLAIRLFAEIRRTVGQKLPLSALFEGGTVVKLAALIQAGGGSAPDDTCLVPIQPHGTRRPFFLASGGLGGDAELLIYARLARHLGAEQPFYGLRARSVGPGRWTNEEVENIAAGHIAEIQAVQPDGPYLLGGECIGGVVAVEMARQLRAQGQSIALLCLLDTDRPSWHIRLADQRMRLAQRMEQIARRTKYAVRSAFRAVRRRPPVPGGPPRTAGMHGPYLMATRRYRPRLSVERFTVLASRDQQRSDPTLGWRQIAGGGLEVHSLPGTHDTYIRQNVQSTGECLRACLERAATQ